MKTMRPISIFLLAGALALPAQAQDFRELPVTPAQEQEQKPLTKEQLFQLAQGRAILEDGQAADPGDLEMLQRLIQENGRNHMLLAPQHRPERLEQGSWVIGVMVEPIEPILREHFGIEEGTGARVSFVDENRTAGKAGIKVHDIIVSADGRKIANVEQLREVVTRCGKESRPVDLEVIHQGKRQTISLAAQRPDQPAILRPVEPDFKRDEIFKHLEHHYQLIRELQKEVRQLRKQVKEQAKDDEDQE